ncbi:MAG: hypothetical protein WBF90_06485 [Rivularia sp. (in: cyanobacteria)]
MSYVNRVGEEVINEPVVTSRVVDYHDRVRWGPIISGLLVGLATQLILSALFGAIGATFVSDSSTPGNIAPNIAGNVGIWSTIALLISLFVAGWITTRACGPMNRSTALLNGAILWATTLSVSSWLLASGVSGAFGVAAYNAGEVINQIQVQGADIPQNVPNISTQQASQIAQATSKGLWWFVFGSLLGLIASMVGAAAGARTPRPRHQA